MKRPAAQEHCGTFYGTLFRVSRNALKPLHPACLNISETILAQDERFDLAIARRLLILAASIAH
jgi:hypothetical protein